MRRKIVKQGAATMMISLPSKWIKKNELNKGDELNIEEKNNLLVISAETPASKKQAEINITSLIESSVRTLITNTYRLGYDKIKINYKDKEALKIIKQSIEKDLIGFEIIKTGDDFAIIENITEPSKEQFESIFHKVFMNIDELFNITERMFQDINNRSDDFEHVEQKIKQFDNFCRRIIFKYDSDNYLRLSFHSKFIHAQREIYLILRFLSKSKLKLDKETYGFLKKCRDLFEKLKKAYTEKSISLLEEIHSIEKELIYKQGYGLMKKNKDNIVLYHILGAIRNFYLSTSPLMGYLISKD